MSGREAEYVNRVLKSGWISSQGPDIRTFEERFAKRFGKRYGIATSSCTTALHLSLAVLGIGHGDEVICPNLTFIAPANMIALTGAKPVLVDVEENSWNLNPKLTKGMVTQKTKAIIVVHAFGHAARMDEIQAIADQHNLSIIEDNAESLGGGYKGRPLGSIGLLSCYSFFANKILTTGEGGMVLTDNEELYQSMLVLRDHGMSRKQRYLHVVLGFNYRMTNIQAALGLAQLERLEEILHRRQLQEQYYEELLSRSDQIELRPKQPWAETVHWLMTIRLKKDGIRNQMLDYLKKQGIDCRQMVYPVNNARHFRDHYDVKAFPVSERVSRNAMHLPSSTKLSHESIDLIIETFFKGLKLYG